MDDLSVRVIPFSKEQCPFDKNREHTWQEWHTFRNAVLDILSRYGSIGPMGKLPILDTYEEKACLHWLVDGSPTRRCSILIPMPAFSLVSETRTGCANERPSGSVRGCALKARGIQSFEITTAAKLSSQPRTESCVVSGNGHCEA